MALRVRALRCACLAAIGFSAADAKARDLAAVGYRRGVPMGQDLRRARGAAPSFLVHAVKDERSGNLDRVQMIKGWVDAPARAMKRSMTSPGRAAAVGCRGQAAGGGQHRGCEDGHVPQ